MLFHVVGTVQVVRATWSMKQDSGEHEPRVLGVGQEMGKVWTGRQDGLAGWYFILGGGSHGRALSEGVMLLFKRIALASM